MPGTRRPVLVARGLAVRAAGEVLLAPSSFELLEGERALLVGPSGSGKSLLLDVLLGLVRAGAPGLDVQGTLETDGVDLLGRGPSARAGRVGAVFQMDRLGLFLDLSAEENLRFGSRDPARAAAAARGLGLPAEALAKPVGLLSGGQKARVALARTLLSGAGILVADEPTSGLDPVSARQAVEALRAAHRRLTLVVTHDAPAFAGFADAVLRLDPATREVRRDPAEGGVVPVAAGSAPPPRPVAPVRRLLAGLDRAALGAFDLAADVVAALAFPWALLRARHPLDGPRVRRELRRDLAPGVAGFVATSAALVAVTATWFLFERLPRREYTEPLVQEGLLRGLGLVLTRVAVPLFASVLLAAKLGASSAAHLGQMTLTRQVDALRLLDVPVRRHLLLPTAAAQVLAAAVHTAVGIAVAFASTAVVFLATHPGFSWLYVRRAFARELDLDAVPWLLAKVGASALAVSVVAFRIGTSPKRGPEDVLRGLHRTLLVSLLLVLALHAAFALVEF